MVNAPAVSIAIRAFRREWLGGAIASVLDQTWCDLELIVYDDAGDLEAVTAGFDDARIRYVRAEKAFGPSGRFLAATALCRGEFIGLLDDDDRYEARFVERLAGALQNDPRAGVAYCRGLLDADGIRFSATPRGQPGPPRELLRKILSKRWVIPPSMMMIRRAALDDAGKIQAMPDGVAPDVFTCARIALAGWEHLFVDEMLVVRGWHNAQYARTPAIRELAVSTFAHLRTADEELDRLRREELARRYFVLAASRVLRGRFREAGKDLAATRTTAVSLPRLIAGVAKLAIPAAVRFARFLLPRAGQLRPALSQPTKSFLRGLISRIQRDSSAAARRKAHRYLAGRDGKAACLHLGCGWNVIDGWLNVDALPADDRVIAADLRKGLRFLDDASIDFIYHEHFFEHLDRRSARRFLQECLRVLKPNGWMRMAMPDLDRTIERYVAGQADEKGEFREHRRRFYGEQLLDTPGEMLDLSLRGYEHRYIYSERDIVRMLELNGFAAIRRVAYRQSELPPFRGIESRNPERSALIVEASRGASRDDRDALRDGSPTRSWGPQRS
jgi:predicted SAM-dependent methyltransferase/glycosyltransferase involved in cell wall biosynthesis